MMFKGTGCLKTFVDHFNNLVAMFDHIQVDAPPRFEGKLPSFRIEKLDSKWTLFYHMGDIAESAQGGLPQISDAEGSADRAEMVFKIVSEDGTLKAAIGWVKLVSASEQ